MKMTPTQSRVIEIQQQLATINAENDEMIKKIDENNTKSRTLLGELSNIATLQASKDTASA